MRVKEYIDSLLENHRAWLDLPRDLRNARNVFALAVAAVIGAQAFSPLESSTSAQQDIEYGDALSASKNGVNLEVHSAAKHRIPENLDGEKYLYGYLKTKLLTDHTFAKLSKANQENILDALISLLSNLNPDINLNIPNEFKGQELVFPKELALQLEAPEGPMSTGGYPYLQDAALLDGMDVRDTSKTDAIYEAALESGVELPQDAPSFYRKYGVTTPSKLAIDVYARFTTIADRFFEETGYRIAYTDILRNAAMIAATPGSIKGSTHPTGRSIDIADGRFKTTDGKEITWSIKGENGKDKRGPDADLIENLRKQLIGIMQDDGIFIFEEAGHWHLYFPKKEPYLLDLNQLFLFNRDEIALEDLLPPAEDIGSADTEAPHIGQHSPVLNGVLAQQRTKVDKATAKQQWNDILKRFDPNGKLKRPALTLLTLGSSQEGLQMDAVEWIDSLNPATFYELAPLKGTTVHKDSSRVPNYSDTRKIWDYKVKHKLGNSSQWKAPIEKLAAKYNRKISFEGYIQTIETANQTLKNNREDFNLPSWAEYLTPEVNIAILQAEFFSEFRGKPANVKAFIHLLPSLFEHYDIMRGPAINDRRLSGGCIQVIDTTYDDIIRRHKTALKKVGHPAPEKSAKEAYLEAMVFDIDKQALTNQLIIIDHLSLGMAYLLKDTRFKTAWEKATPTEKTRFLGTLAPLAINGGRGVPPRAAKIALAANNSTDLDDYTESIGKIGENDVGDGIGSFAARGANVGYLTMQVFFPNQ